MRAVRVWTRVSLLVLVFAALPGCGSKFTLPTETPGGNVPPEDSYTFKGSLEGTADLTDVWITRSSGNQLLVVNGAEPDLRTTCDPPGISTLPAGGVKLFPIFPRSGTPPLSVRFDGMWRPSLVAEGGGQLFVLDAGDTCFRDSRPDSAPRVVVYRIGEPAPIASFGDTNWAEVRGLAVSSDHTVYVSGTFRVLEPDEFNRRTKRFRDAIWRYKESDAYQRDTGWVVLEGTGIGFVAGQKGIAWGPSSAPYLWVADGDKQAVQKMAIETDSLSHGIYLFDGTESGQRFLDAVDVDVDGDGFVYVVDRGSARVVRYKDEGDNASFVQKVNLGILLGEPALVAPQSVAVFDTIVYVADPPSNAARRYERRRQ